MLGPGCQELSHEPLRSCSAGMDAIPVYLHVALASKLRTHVVFDWQHLIHRFDVSNKRAWDSNFWLCLGGYNVGNFSKLRKYVQKKLGSFKLLYQGEKQCPGKKLGTK